MTAPSYNSRRSTPRPPIGEYKRKDVPRFSLDGTPIWERYVTSSADKKRELVLTLLDGSVEKGWPVGLDDDWLEVLVLETREQIMLAVPNILKVSRGRSYFDLEDEDKSTVDNFISSFRGASVAFLKRAWPSSGEVDDNPTSERQR